jgi:hypothetical protein
MDTLFFQLIYYLFPGINGVCLIKSNEYNPKISNKINIIKINIIILYLLGILFNLPITLV